MMIKLIHIYIYIIYIILETFKDTLPGIALWSICCLDLQAVLQY